MSIDIKSLDKFGLYTEEDIKLILEKVLSDTNFAKAILEGKNPCKIEKPKRKQISPLHKYIFLYFLFDEIFGYKQKELYKRDENQNLLTKEDIITYLLQKPIFNGKEDEIKEAIKNVLEYEKKISNDFMFTYYQFFAVLFTELFFLFKEEIKETLKKLIESNYHKVREIYAIKEEELEIIKNNPEKIYNLPKMAKNEKRLQQLREKLSEGIDFIEAVKEVFKKDITTFEEYINDSMNKLAYYMATGAGKTHILHINLLQAKKYLSNIDKYFLIVPNNELALQHKKNLEKFKIKNIGFIEEKKNKTLSKDVENLILEYDKQNYEIVILTVHQLNSFIKKYKDREMGDFGNNVIFVDEGHKGDVKGWRSDRNKLAGKEGFIFEYSATFAQAIKDNENLIREYSKSIIYFYPYHKFHNDGYGKTPVFYPKDIVDDKLEKKTIKDISKENYELFIQNILSHYKQIDCYLKHKEDIEFLERFKLPLSMFVVYRVSSDKNQVSDVYQIYNWLNRFTRNENNETVNLIKKYKNNFGIEEEETEVFKNIKEKCFYGKYEDNQIRVWQLNKNEIAFSLSDADNSFAVVYVGDALSIPEFDEHIKISNLTQSIITDFLKNPDEHKLQFLIVGRKLIEGFDTIRINNLSLVNIGKKEGSLVVQLFGRGVRLKGSRNEPLKRENVHPLMERLNIFGYNAKFLKDFIEETEVIEILDEEEYTVKIEIDENLLKNKKIPVIEVPFEESNEFHFLEKNKEIKERLLKKYSNIIKENDDGIDIKKLIDFKLIFNTIIKDYKHKNILISYELLENVFNFLFDGKFELKVKFKNLKALEKFVVLVLNEYISNFVKLKKNEYENKNITLLPLQRTHKNLDFSYSIRIPSTSILNEILKKYSKNNEIIISYKSSDEYCFESIYLESEENKELFALKIDKHIYKPLLCKINNFDVSISPDRLEKSEIKFVDSFCKYINKNKEKELTLLRNLKTAIGFSRFYPDFILWYVDNETEHIIFLDPKGMTSHNIREVLKKAKLSLRLKELEKELHKNPCFKNVRLHSFILLNNPLEEYLRIPEIKDSINNFFAEEMIGGIRGLKENDLIDLMHLFNIFYSENENLFEEILAKLNEPIYSKLNIEKNRLKDF